MENQNKAMDILIKQMQNNEDLKMKKQEVLKEYNEVRTQEAPKINWKEKVLRATMRPLLHVLIEFMGMSVLAAGMMFSIIAVLLIAMYAVVWAAEMAGIEPNSVQSGILAVAACSTAIYTFYIESKRALKTLRNWTDAMHRQIERI